MLREARFNPNDPKAKQAVGRMRAFHRTVAAAASRYFPAMPINDGAAFFRDLSERTRSVTYDFLQQAIQIYQTVNEVDKKGGSPGARMIIGAGFRLRSQGVLKMSPGYKENIFSRVESGKISVTQAVHEAFRNRPVCGFVPELQANFAFTKAFLADEDGSRAGLGGATCYIDLALFEKELPHWIKFSRQIEWSTPGMSATFGEFSSIDTVAAGASSHKGISHRCI
jgi:hypothetical protein